MTLRDYRRTAALATWTRAELHAQQPARRQWIGRRTARLRRQNRHHPETEIGRLIAASIQAEP